jgi:hypothetical protein
MEYRKTRLTLDTNLVHEFLKQRPKADLVKKLIELAEQGIVELAVTARIREDIPEDPLASRLNELPELGIAETGSVARVGFWVLGRDMLGSQEFEEFSRTACGLALESGRKGPDWRDWDHLHAHMLADRDVSLTWDNGILCLAPELRTQLGVRVMSPEEYLNRLNQNLSLNNSKNICLKRRKIFIEGEKPKRV